MIFLALIVALILGFVVFIAPIRWVAFALGIVLPIDLVSTIDPIIFDLIRYGLATSLIFRCRFTTKNQNKHLNVSFWLLATIGAYITIAGIANGANEMLVRGTIGILSALFALLLARISHLHSALLAGFVLGASLSGLDILLQVAGLPYLGSATDWGYRYSGLSFSSTNTAPFLANAVVIILAYKWKLNTSSLNGIIVFSLRLIALIILIPGLFYSGGRGGFAGLIFAFSIYGMFTFKLNPLRVVTILTITIIFVMYNINFFISYITRDGATEANGLSSGRSALNSEAWGAFLSAAPLGVPVSERVLYRPHTPVLTFALDAGLLGLIIGILLVSILAKAVLVPRESSNYPVVYRMIGGIMLVTSILEPAGFFIGFAKALLFLILIYVLDQSRPTGTIVVGSSSEVRK